MSGTSLDGVDLACCYFEEYNGIWSYKIQVAETIPYSEQWKERLRNLENASAFEYVRTDLEYGHYLGHLSRKFITDHEINPDFIASHGHTIFHQPDKRITAQIGQGSAIVAETGIPVVCDFRTADVALNGQGAPLVPIGDRMLFHEYDYCLNLGGFANISFEEDEKRIAFDICPANIVLNYFSAKAGFSFDRDGALARSGKPCDELLQKLNALPFYKQPPPKSLGKEWVVKHVLPMMESFDLPVEDLLRTFCEHIATQISIAVKDGKNKKILVTGGGTLNFFLMDELNKKSGVQLLIPDENTINFKEALIFAFLGVLRWTNRVNCLCSVTGADKDCIGGAIYYEV